MKNLITALVLLTFTLNSFSQRTEKNYYHVDGYSEYKAKQYFDGSSLNDIEGIWQSTDGFKYSIEKDVENNFRSESKYRMIVLENAGSYSWWKPTYIKAFIEYSSVSGIYSMKYYTNTSTGGNLEVQNCFVVLENKAMLTFTRIDNGEKIMLVKLYPKIDEDEKNISPSQAQASSGTGFAISSNGYIVTNHHVINGAKSIEVKGINGNFTRKLSAEIAVSDEKNDLAIIKINDPYFTSLGTIPYTFRQALADVGESVFVLGYPMTRSMGEEVKLTNGIISSKTGFQGDISMYQISAPIQPGNSGGPLFDKKGNLLGIVSAKHTLAENAGYAIKVSYLKNLIELLPETINQPALNVLTGKDLTEQVKIASNYTYLIVINDKGNSYTSSNESNNQKKTSTSEQNAAIYYQKAEELWKNKDPMGALEQINYSIEASSNYAGSFYFRGFIYLYGIRNFEKAVEDFTKSIQMQPDFEGAYFYRGMSYNALEKNIEAIKDFTKVISMNKDNTDAYFMRALIKSNMNDRQGAISDYEEIIKREKSATPSIYKMSTVYNNKAYCLVELDKPNEALPFVSKALNLDESEAYIWDTRGEIYFKLGDYEKCIKDMNKSISIDEEADNSYYLRGLAKIKLGKKDEGCKDLSKAGELGKTEAYEAINTYCK